MCGVFVVPLHETDKWKVEKFSHLPANEISFSKDGMLVHINKSASPLIFPIGQAKKIKSFKINGEFRGLPTFKDVAKQGEKGADDYALRLGFVVSGTKRMNGIQRMFAATWVKNLYALAPPGAGIDRIEFFNVTQNPSQLGKSRVHPLSDLLKENFFAKVATAGAFNYDYKLETPLDAAALWISIDGDDTKSVYDVLISSLELTTD